MSIDLIGPDGGEYVIDDPSKLTAALQAGYRQVTLDAPQTLGESAKAITGDVVDTIGAGIQGAGQGLTAGLIGAGIGAKQQDGESDEDYKLRRFDASEMQRRAEEHPIAHTIGELGGAVLSPISGLQGAVTKGIGATTALGRIGANVVGGGVVGLLYGAGNTMSDAALGDHDLTAEKLVAGAGLGALVGGAGSGLGSALGEAWDAVTPRVGKAIAGFKEPLQDFAEHRWLKAGGAIQGDIKKIPESERAAVANVIREAMTPTGRVLPASLEEAAGTVAAERDQVAASLLKTAGLGEAGGLKPGMNQEEALGAISKAINENGAKVGAVLKRADAMGATPSYSAMLGRFDSFEQGLNPAEKDLIAGDLTKVRNYLTEMGSKPVGPKTGFTALNDIKSTIQKDTNWTADGAARFGLKRQLSGIIRDEIDTQLAPQVGSDLAREFLDAKQAFGALSQAEKALGRKASTGADAIAALVDGAKLAEPSLAGKLSALDQASRLISHGMDRNLGNRFLSPSDYATGIAAGFLHGGPLGAMTGLGSAIGHKVLRERGAGVIAKLADTIAASPQLSVAARSFGTKLASATPFLGEYAPLLQRALAAGPAVALATHMTWAQANPHYAEVAQSAGFLPETPEEHSMAMARAGGMAGLEKLIAQQDAELDHAVGRVLKGETKPKPPAVLGTQDFGAKRMRRDDEAAHRQRMDEIQQLAADPSKIVERVAANLGALGDIAPGVAAAATNTAHNIITHLASVSQEPPKPGPLAPDWIPSEAERHEFAARLEVAENPMAVLKHAASGTLTQAQADTFRACYPKQAENIAEKMLDRLAGHPQSVPQKSRMMIYMLTGVDPDGSFGALAYTQSVISSQKTDKAGSDMAQQSGKSNMTLAQRTATPNQKSQMRES